ncbi:MAG: putative Holliday junction resolvase [Firmicutes bacterium ADurb.Bin182]|nr:MAG: putative Holliday junction resolvase [Firmicutes bacterium ADurb.Bin182]
MQRIMSLDIGDKRIGIAVSDPLGITAQGLQTYTRTGDLDKDTQYIVELADKFRPVKLLFGMPRNMDGSYGFQSEKVRAFAEAVLKKWNGEHDYYDERLTTVAAERVLNQAELSWKKQRKVIDKVAASVILQDYLENVRNKEKSGGK